MSSKAGGNKRGQGGDGPQIENRRARFDYHIGETLECGMVLWGPEVKSLRAGQASLGEGYVAAESEPPSLWLHGVMIAEYGPAGPVGGSSGQPLATRTRKLLAHKREIVKLFKAASVKGNTLVPLKIYFKNGYAKCLVGVGTGKKAHDKRQTIKERESQRDIDRAMSKRRDR